MKHQLILYHGADECFGCSGDELLAVLMRGNEALARERQDRKGPCDGGMVWRDGAEILTLVNEHWVETGLQRLK